jgi:hypothetical protein
VDLHARFCSLSTGLLDISWDFESVHKCLLYLFFLGFHEYYLEDDRLYSMKTIKRRWIYMPGSARHLCVGIFESVRKCVLCIFLGI